MNRRNHIRRLHALLVLLLILFVHGGQAVHVFTEDLRHFSAFCGTADDGEPGMSEVCFLCDFHFCSHLAAEAPARFHYASPLVRMPHETAQSVYGTAAAAASLRAPPVTRG